jgi:hypothetical protein
MSRTFIVLSLVVCLLVSVSGQAKNYHDELRLYNKVVYKIEDTYGFVIYSKDVHVVGSKARLSERKYFFSLNERSEIIPLTINNLKHTFRDHEFHDLLDIHFRSNHELTRYDHYSKEYKLKYIFRKAFNANGAE